MLKGISPLLSPDLLATLCQMGHGDEIVLADAHFPGHKINERTLRADGLTVDQLIDAILPLFSLDIYAPPLIMMQAVQGDQLDPAVHDSYRQAIDRHESEAPDIEYIDRFAFYERAKNAFVVVITSETRKYGNLLIKKGVTPSLL